MARHLVLLLVSVLALACQDEAAAPAAAAVVSDVRDDGGALTPDASITPGPGADADAPDAVVPATGCAADRGAFGCPCIEDDDCTTGRCVDVEGGRICTQDCVSECPAGFACVGASGGGLEVTYLCLPRFVKLCQPCKDHLDCQSKGDIGLALCLDYGDAGSFCGAACGDVACPAGSTCTDVTLGDGTPTRQCRRDDGLCACSALGKALGMSTTCRVTNAQGSCAGQRVCAADGLSACSAPTPTAELCDQVDNNCDDVVDNLATNAACAVKNEFGGCPGVETCVGGLTVCVGPSPAPDVCDGVDNDCNGYTDEGYLDTDKDGAADCFDPDDDGDGVLDELDVCPLTPDPGQQDLDKDGAGDACDPDDDGDGSLDVDDCAPKAPAAYPGAPEVCNGADDDCDGQTDEGLCDDGVACTADLCASGTSTCQHVPNPAACDDGSPCTADTCGAEGCVYTPAGSAACDDGDECTTGDTCVAGVCFGVPGAGCCTTTADCDDKNPCTQDVCNQAIGKCSHQGLPDQTACDADGSGCTVGDVCLSGSCIAGAAVVCPSGGDPCVIKACLSTGPASYSCQVAPAAATVSCDDGQFCTTGDHCDAKGGCVGGGPRNCIDAVGPCDLGICDETANACIPSPKPEGAACNADDDGCTVGDRCVGGLCIPGDTPDCSALEGDCVVGMCAALDADFWECVPAPKPAGVACDDAQYCTLADACNGEGLCVGGGESPCPSTPGSCQGTFCDEASHACLPLKRPDGSGCDDGVACTLTDSCSNGVCVGTEDACVEEPLSVGATGGAVPSIVHLGFGRYAVQWTSAGAGVNQLRFSDTWGSRENEERALAVGASSPQGRLGLAAGLTGEVGAAHYMGSASCASTATSGACYCNDAPLVTTNSALHLSSTRYNGQPLTSAAALPFTLYADGCPTPTATLSGLHAEVLAFADAGYGIVEAHDFTAAPQGQVTPPADAIRYIPSGADLAPGAAVVLIPSTRTTHPHRFAARLAPNGTDFWVAWVDDSGSRVFARRFDRAGTLGGELLVYDGGSKPVVDVRMATRPDGGAVVVMTVVGGDPSGSAVIAQRVSSALALAGTSFRVNTNTNGDQRLGDIATFSTGGFVVVWEDATGDVNGAAVKAQRYTPAGAADGGELRVNTVLTGDQGAPGVAVLDADQWIVAFTGANGQLWTRRFLADGSPAVGRLEARAHVKGTGPQTSPAGAARPGGQVLVAWQTPVFGKPGLEIAARFFAATGSKVGDEFAVNTAATGDQAHPAVAAGASRFVVAWQSEHEGDSTGIYARLYDSVGKTLSGELHVNTATAGAQASPTLAVTPAGTVAVAYTGPAGLQVQWLTKDGAHLGAELAAGSGAGPTLVADGASDALLGWASGANVYVRRVSGSTLGAPAQLNASSAAGHVTLGVTAAGLVVACWQRPDGAGTSDLACRFVERSSLAPLSDELLPHALTAGNQAAPRLAPLPTGEVALAWQSEGVDGSGSAIQLVRLGVDGLPASPRLVVNRYWAGDQSAPFVVSLSGGSVMVGWESAGQDGDGGGVYVRALPPQ